MAIDINPRDREILFSLLERYLPNTAVWAYGSRVMGCAKPWSDLDLVVFTGMEQKYRLSLLKEAFEESNLSCRIQLWEWDYLPDSFKINIEASHAIII
jgi:predicted nucleotidyltransferase